MKTKTKIPNRKYANGATVSSPLTNRVLTVKGATYNGYMWVYAFEGEHVRWGEKYLRPVQTVDATPSWVSLVPLYIEWIQDGNSMQHTTASDAIHQMAKISDAYREHQKELAALLDAIKELADMKKKVRFDLLPGNLVEKINKVCELAK